MNTKTRALSLILALLMMFQLAAPGVWFTPAKAAEYEPMQMDPVTLTPGDAIPTMRTVSEQRPVMQVSEEDYTTTTQASLDLANAMRARSGEVVLYVFNNTFDPEVGLTDAEIEAMVYEIYDYAMGHTGEPEEGDYLYWNCHKCDFYFEEGYYLGEVAYLTFRVELGYFTTAEQEQQLSSALTELYAQWDIQDADDYTKIRTVYDYICGNVVYDAESELDKYYDGQDTAYAAFCGGNATSQGMALLFYRMMLPLRVDCRVVAGTIDGQHRVWNIVELENRYYNLDASLDTGKTAYEDFLRGSDNFQDHVRYEEYETEYFLSVQPMDRKDYPYCDHVYDAGVVTTAPTCTADGVKTFTCSLCGGSYTEVVAALGHDYDEGVVTTAPACTEAGVKTITCSLCGDAYTEQIPALGHSYDGGVETAAPTCTEDGVKTTTCTVCGDAYTEAIPATGHSKNEGVVSKEPTCTETGVMDYVCTVCGEAFTEEIAMLPHDYADGFCTVCGGAQMTVPAIVSCYSQSQTSVKITWTVSEGAEGYEIWRTTDRDDPDSWARIKTVADAATDRYTNQGLTEGVTYYYKIRAYATNADGSKIYTDFSNVHYMPAAVVFDSPYSNATFRIRLRWHEVDGAHGYQIWRKTADSDYTVVKTIGDRGNAFTTDAGSTTAYSNTSLEAGQKYTYKIRAYMFTEDGRRIWGTFSDEVTVAAKPENPSLSGASPKAGRVKLTWDIPAGADGYQIWMDTSADGAFSVSKNITSGETTAYTQYDLVSGQTYYFKIRAYSEGQYKLSYSEFSDVISVTVK